MRLGLRASGPHFYIEFSSCEFTAICTRGDGPQARHTADMADAALAALPLPLRAATRECATAASHFNPKQSAEAVALAAKLRALFSGPTTAATAELCLERQTPLLPELPSELIAEVLGGSSVNWRAHADSSTSVRPARHDPCLSWRKPSAAGRARLGDGRRRPCRQA